MNSIYYTKLHASIKRFIFNVFNTIELNIIENNPSTS